MSADVANDRVTAQSGIYFDASNPDFILLGNDYYEIGVSKTNGALTFIEDKATGQNVSAGSRYSCLWGSVFETVPQPNDYVGGCLYRHDNADREFTWVWHPSDGRLALRYIANPDQYVEINAWVDITLSTDPWFDMRLFLENKGGDTVERVLFPSDLMFLKSDMQELLLPVMPGVVLKPGIFDEREPYWYTIRYPGWPGVFADYQALESTRGRLALYTIHKTDEIITTEIGPIEDSEHPGSFYLYHTFYSGIADNNIWESPMVRIHIGQPYPQTLAAYRTHNQFAAFPDLRTKAGSRYDQLVRSPLIKADTDKSISVYETLLPQIPAPAILHWVSFWPYSFDENYPDLLPPKPEFGTTIEMATLFGEANAAGFLNMPYTNPTWWDDEAPTFEGLSPTNVAVLGRGGDALYECYTGSADPPDCTPENAARDSTFNIGLPPYQWLHGGYVVSPHVDQVQQRLAQLQQQMKADIPSDLVFEDQVGARAMTFDYNPDAPTPTSYHQGWLEHTRVYSANLLMTEAGYDRLAETETGFHGSYLLAHVTTDATTEWWGVGNWHVYPLTAFLTRDKTLFYQHNLAPETFTYNLSTLRWNLATGYMLSYDTYASEYGGGLESPWLGLVATLQSEVLSRYADELAVDFDFVEPEVSLTAFETYSVTANWNAESPYTIGAHQVSPGGVYVWNNDDIVAGMFDVYNGEALSGTGHFIIEERASNAIVVWQPLGAQTILKVLPLSDWSTGDTVLVLACEKGDHCINVGTVPITGNAIRFTYSPVVNDTDVWCYKLVKVSARLYLPLVLVR
ncbi:MAG: hypothetical protein JXA14_11110 [Anaerolineae bacterium]|nr:hypothetical protein [Anaerolineae bacterium]